MKQRLEQRAGDRVAGVIARCRRAYRWKDGLPGPSEGYLDRGCLRAGQARQVRTQPDNGGDVAGGDITWMKVAAGRTCLLR